MIGGLRDCLAVFAPNDSKLGQVEFGQKFLVAASMIPMMVSVYDGSEVDLAVLDSFLQYRSNFGRVGRIDDHRVLGFVIDDEVGVVVAAANPHGN